MIWLITVASLLGFLAVDTLANQPLLAAYNEKTWLLLAIVLLVILIASLGFSYWQTRRLNQIAQTGYLLKSYLGTVFLSGFIFVTVLLLSASYGLYQSQRYQNTLLKAPLTVNATVQAHQISDTLTQTITLPNENAVIGNSYIRQLLDVTLPQDSANPQALTNPQTLTALVSTNIQDHPDWEATLTQLKPGQQLKVKLLLQPIGQSQHIALPSNAKPLNLGFNEAQWLRQRGVQATGTLLTVQQNSLSDFKPTNFTDARQIAIEKLRWQLRQKLWVSLQQTLVKQPTDNQRYVQSHVQNYAILLGLLTGDKSLMDSSLKNLYQVTGISHLLAISGPHVLLLATMVSLLVLWLVKVFVPSVLTKLPSSLLVLWVSVGVAGFYAMLVGFEIPAQRTFWMLLLLTLSKQLLFKLSAYRLLAWVALGIVWFDTTAVGQAGFWLSFVAVVLLLKLSEKVGSNSDIEFNSFAQIAGNSHANPLINCLGMIFTQFKLLLTLQLWLFVWMLPIVVWFFGKVSLMGILVNLVAVPFLGLVVVPLDMLAGIVSWLPLIGDWLSHEIWSLLAHLLNIFHTVLNQLVDLGFAKQSFLAVSQSQLAICVLIAIVWLLRGLLPRMLILPMGIVLLLIPVAQQAASNRHPTLAVMGNPKMGISLVKKGADSWLILSDNQLERVKTAKQPFFKPKQPATTFAADEAITAILTNDIYPLLAQQHIQQLTGVISQTPSVKVNQLVQQLAATIPTKHYWLAGYDIEKANISGTNDSAGANFSIITPKNCQNAQAWQQAGLEIKAISGWQLDVPLTTDEKMATQTCLIRIDYRSPSSKPYSALVVAGHSEIPMQMSEKLCTVSMTNLLIQPYNAPIKQSWLALTKPSLLHVLTGQYDNQKLLEDSQLSLASWQANQPDSQVMYAHQTGGVIYTLNPVTQRED